jgi:Tfp pilus assembly protein PilN
LIRINLLPTNVRAAQAQRQIAAALVALGAVAVLAMVGWLGWKRVDLRAKERDLAQARAELSKYQALVNEVSALETKRNELRARRDIIQQLLKGRLLYPKFFEDFMGLLPPEVWVTSLTTTPEAQPGMLKVSVNAQSTSNYAIADWMTNLMGSPLCTQVELGAVSSADAEEGRPPVLTFTLTFRYLRGEA